MLQVACPRTAGCRDYQQRVEYAASEVRRTLGSPRLSPLDSPA